LPWHLKEGGRATELRQLLFNFDWLQAKLEATVPNALIADYNYLGGEEEFRLIQSAIQLSAHVLARDHRQLAGQLIGRLLDIGRTEIEALLKQAAEKAPMPWLRPLRASLSPPRDRFFFPYSHRGEMSSVAITPDGRRAISTSYHNTLHIWDLEFGLLVRRFEGLTKDVRGIAITPDGCRAVSGFINNTLCVRDLESGAILSELEGHTHSITAVAVTPDGREAVSASTDRTLRLWDLESGQCLRTLEGHTGGVWALAATPDGRRALSLRRPDPTRLGPGKRPMLAHP
jgi:hypothetical protein